MILMKELYYHTSLSYREGHLFNTIILLLTDTDIKSNANKIEQNFRYNHVVIQTKKIDKIYETEYYTKYIKEK